MAESEEQGKEQNDKRKKKDGEEFYSQHNRQPATAVPFIHGTWAKMGFGPISKKLITA